MRFKGRVFLGLGFSLVCQYLSSIFQFTYFFTQGVSEINVYE